MHSARFSTPQLGTLLENAQLLLASLNGILCQLAEFHRVEARRNEPTRSVSSNLDDYDRQLLSEFIWEGNPNCRED